MDHLMGLVTELRSTLTRVEKILATIHEAIVWTDEQGRIFWCNSAFDKLVKQPRILNLGSLIAQSLPLLNSDLVSHCEVHPAFLALQTKNQGQAVYGLQQADQVKVIEISWASFQPEGIDLQQALSAVLVIRDITDRHQAQMALKEANLYLEERVQERTEALQRMIFQDALTQLPSRNFLRQTISEFIDNNNFTFTLIYLDCDQFKLVNGSFGFEVGNQLLMAIAQRLQQCLPTGDLLVRMGEDEFCFFLAALPDQATLSAQIDKIKEQFILPFEVSHCEIFVTVSIGVTQGDPTYKKAEEFLQNVGIAMYRAKKKNRETYQVFNHIMRQEIIDYLTLESRLQQAIKRQEFVNYYQPIINLENQSIAGFEALVRWHNPQYGMISPTEFIPAMENSGLIVPVGILIFHMACLQLNRWHQLGWENITMSVNFSARQFASATLLEDIDLVLSETQVNPNFIKLEITESAIMDDAEHAIHITEKARERGLQISVDDFGTGYSSLGYLHRFAIDNLKIDRSFVIALEKNQRKNLVINSIISLAQELGLAVVAEGIESQYQLQYLQDLGCEYGQGFFFAKPLTVPEIEKKWLLPQ
jgi:diguanylate cyclase (GGDEF)-like protein